MQSTNSDGQPSFPTSSSLPRRSAESRAASQLLTAMANSTSSSTTPTLRLENAIMSAPPSLRIRPFPGNVAAWQPPALDSLVPRPASFGPPGPGDTTTNEPARGLGLPSTMQNTHKTKNHGLAEEQMSGK